AGTSAETSTTEHRSGPAGPPSAASAMISHITALTADESSRTRAAVDITRWISENGLTNVTQ
ncbi:MAG: hypothetical protein ACLFM0_06885, partial [Spirochaetales bacterium]